MLGCQTYCISDSPSNRYCLIGPIECNEKLIEVFKKGITVKLKYVEKWDYQDCYITISHCDCDDNSLFSDRIKNSIEPELWISLDVITNYLPDIKQNHL